MKSENKYLYDNTETVAIQRLEGLERIEDMNTISSLEKVPSLRGARCLELGAGAGSIAEWLSDRVGEAGQVIATDIEPTLLNRSKYEVLKHNLETDDLPEKSFDVVHFRHLLIHLKDHRSILKKIADSLKNEGWLVAEESDLSSWQVNDGVTDADRLVFQEGVDALLGIYRSRGMATKMGSELSKLIQQSGLNIVETRRESRHVTGGSHEAMYQSASAEQLAGSLPESDVAGRDKLTALSMCLQSKDLTYTSRTTVSVMAAKASCLSTIGM